MQPIPAEILEQYPQPCPAPGRPWWSVRDKVVSAGRNGTRTVPQLYRHKSGSSHFHFAASCEDAARIDGEHPIAFPGFRVGQIWVYLARSARRPHRVALINGGTADVGEFTSCGDRARLRPKSALWLLHDPVCPWLAPWGAPEVAEE